MELITIIGGAVGAIIAAIAMDLIRDQAKASTPRIAEWLRGRAVKRLPEELRERLDEEWAALLNDTVGPLAKLWCCVGLLISTLRIKAEQPQAIQDMTADRKLQNRSPIEQALDTLDILQLEIIMLSFIDGRSKLEISQELELSYETVKSEMRAAYEKLRDATR
jgi:RNA polymerase sigma factor (sigma-70 family)